MSEELKSAPSENGENEPNNEQQAQAEAPQPPKEVIDVEWEELRNIFSARSQLAGMENHMGRMFVQFEKSRHELTNRISYLEQMIYKLADDLKGAKGIGNDHTYELKLPNNEGEKGYFLLRPNPPERES